MSVQEIESLVAKAARPPVFGFAGLKVALSIGAELVRTRRGVEGMQFYLRFGDRITLEEADRLAGLASEGVGILWDPDIERNLAVIGGTEYAVEMDGLRPMGPAKVRFSKAGFFDTARAKAVRAQKLEASSGFYAMLILERGERTHYPLFARREVLPPALRSGDAVNAAYLSVVGERTVSGWHAPAEVFFEALAIRVLHSSPSHPPLPWANAREAIDRVLSDFDKPPSGGGKKAEAWQRVATDAVRSALKKEMIYLDADDERYMYREIQERVAGSAWRGTGLRQQAGERR